VLFDPYAVIAADAEQRQLQWDRASEEERAAIIAAMQAKSLQKR
jgi:hypothetical protein